MARPSCSKVVENSRIRSLQVRAEGVDVRASGVWPGLADALDDGALGDERRGRQALVLGSGCGGVDLLRGEP